VDHGKTALVLALTGIDTDRLAEEKRRGITIENGFAHLTFPDGLVAGVIDVPGHERFVKHMLAGAGGIDLALLAVAADDGVMPQTREHLAILKMLNIKSAVVALTKADLAPDADWLDLVRQDILNLTQGAFDRDPEIVPVSVQTGQGLEELREALYRAVLLSPERKIGPSFRLPLDRIFTLPGFGTVVAGTLLGGRINLGDTAMVYPREQETRLRQVQVHSREVETAWPGQRVALNLAGLKKEELFRGDILASPGSLKPTFMLDAYLTLLPDSPFTLKNNRIVSLHLFAREIKAKVVLMNSDELTAGDSDYVQFRLTVPVVARRGDRLVIRLPSPAVTLGGGEILDPCPQKHRRRKPEVLNQFKTKDSGSLRQRVELAIRERPGTFSSISELALRSDLGPKAKEEANILAQKGAVIALSPEIFIHQTEIISLTRKVKNLLNLYHQNNPHSHGPSQEEIRRKLAPQAPQGAWEGLFLHWEKEKLIAREEGLMRLWAFLPRVDEEKNQYLNLLAKTYLDFGFVPQATSTVLTPHTPQEARSRQAAFSSLVRQDILVYLDDLYHIHKQHFAEAFNIFKGLALKGPVEPGPFRDALKTSRKVAVALLENFEKRAWTVKSGTGRLPKA
jgi:selenocysteine-specific elongation factor